MSVALNEFDGTVLLVSHDRALLREVCDEFWLVARGGVHAFDGDLDDYQRWLLDGASTWPPGSSGNAAPTAPPVPAPAPSSQPATPAAKPAAPEHRKAKAQARAKLADRTRPLRMEISQIDQRLAKLAEERTQSEAALTQGGLAPEAIADHGRRLNHIAAEQAMLEERWLELQAELEALQAQG
jgi:ATP-binding cassette, subfamily F, member 3